MYAHIIHTHTSRRKQSKVCNETGHIHTRHAAKRQEGMKGLEGRKKREKKVRAQKHGGGRRPPGMENRNKAATDERTARA